MNRPTLPELAKARAEVQRLLASMPNHTLAPALAVMLRATAPFSKEEAIPVMVEQANRFGGWEPRDDDTESANEALEDTNGASMLSLWQKSIRAQFATLRHFFGGAE